MGALSTKMVDSPAKAPAYPFTTNLGDALASCPALPKNDAPSINTLYPSDFKYIVSIGDSISAGYDSRYSFATDKTPGDHVASFGMSFATGNDTDAYSVGKFVSNIGNSTVKGLSTDNFSKFGCAGECPVWICSDPGDHTQMGYNVALPGAKVVKGDLDKQLNEVENRMSSTTRQSSDWKLVLVEAGFNDICDHCKYCPFQNLDDLKNDYKVNIKKVLDRMTTYKNTVVVLTSPFSPTMMIDKARSGSSKCRDVYKSNQPCDCYKDTASGDTIKQLASDLQDISKDVASNYNSSTTFRVIYDPGLVTADIDTGNQSIEDIVSSKDCFHPTALAHAHFAVSMWNNLFLSSSQKKPYSVDPAQKFFCPTRNDTIKFD